MKFQWSKISEMLQDKFKNKHQKTTQETTTKPPK